MHDDLRVTSVDEETGVMVLNNPRAPRFKRFLGAIGWLDPQGDGLAAQHCFLLGGIQTDDRLLVLDELSGDLSEIISGGIGIKDLFIVSDIYVDTTDSDLMMPVWEADGLTRYVSLGVNPVGQQIWQTDASKWKYFRDRHNIARVCSVPLAVRESQHSGVSRLVQLTKAGKLLVHSRCPGVQLVMDAPKPADVANHPIFKALTYLLYGTQRANMELVSEAADKNTPVRVYKNLRKR